MQTYRQTDRQTTPPVYLLVVLVAVAVIVDVEVAKRKSLASLQAFLGALAVSSSLDNNCDLGNKF